MKKLILLLLVLSLIGCQSVVLKTQPLVYQFMPDSINVLNDLLDTISQPKDTMKYDDFKTIGINNGKGEICVDDSCDTTKIVTLPAGLLISDRKAYKFKYYEIKVDNVNKRLIITKDLLTSYYKQIKLAQQIYNDRILELEKQNQRSWFERNASYIGFAAGVVATIAVEYIAVRVLESTQ